MRALLVVALLAVHVVAGCCVGGSGGAGHAPIAAAPPPAPPPTPEERRVALETATAAATAAPLDDAGHLAEAERSLATEPMELAEYGTIQGHLDALSDGYETRRVRAARRHLDTLMREHGATMAGGARVLIRSGDFAGARELIADIPPGTPSARQQTSLLRQVERGEALDVVRRASRGSPPPRRAGGVPGPVYSYVVSTAHDPGSISFGNCSDQAWHESRGSESWWTVDCFYRGRNAFGALIARTDRFYMQQGAVVRVEPVRHPR